MSCETEHLETTSILSLPQKRLPLQYKQITKCNNRTAPNMATTTTIEATLKTPNGVELYTKSWLPASTPTAQICFIHGFSDHSGRYVNFFPLLAAQGIAIHALDQRGWGKSVKKSSEKGLTGSTTQVMDDITTFLKSHLPSSTPIFLMGHSMGGQETLYWASTGPIDIKKQLSGFIAVAPWIQLHSKSQPSWLKIKAGRLASFLLPHHQLKNELDASVLSHDEAENNAWKNDELCHDIGTLEGLAGALSRADELHTGVVKLQDYDGLRFMIVHGDGDMVTSAAASERFMERAEVKKKVIKIYDDVYHCGKSY